MNKKMKKGVDYIGVGISAAIVNEEGKFLFAKRGKKARNERGKWEFPGGGVEYGDTMRDTIIREIKEELGIIIEPIEQLIPVDHILLDEKQHWITSVFISRIKKGKPSIMEAEKCDDIKWFTLNEAVDLSLTNPTKKYVKILKKKF